jgi:DNA-binding beta-propeller fold protein YncE
MRGCIDFYRDRGAAGARRPGSWRAFVATLLLPVLAASGQLSAADPAPLSIESKIPLGEVHGRIDHLGVDVKRRRLYVAELGNDTVGVVDLQAGKTVQTLPGLKEPQGIGYDASTDTLYVANASDGSVHAFKGSDLSSLGVIQLGDDADNVRIDEAAHLIWVGYGSGALALIDANSRRKVADIPLKAHPESFRLAPSGSTIYVNVPDNREIAIVDRSSNKQTASWKIDDLRANFPLALDEAGQVLAVFRHPARLAVLRPQDGQRLQVLDTCGDSDDLFVDTKRHRAYVTCGQGFIDVFSRGANGYQHTGRLETSSGARTSLFVPELDRLYLAVRAGFSTPASIWVVRPES